MKTSVLQSWQDKWPTVRSTKPVATGEGILDEAAFKTIEVDELFDSINYASTQVGKSLLYRSLTRPLETITEVQDKQKAVKELDENSSLRQQIQQLVDSAAEKENRLLQLLFGRFLGVLGAGKEDYELEGYGYLPYKRGTKLFLDMVDEAEQIESVKSSYLKATLETIKNFADTRAYSLMKGPVYKKEHSLQCKLDRKGDFSPAIIFTPRIFKPLFIISVLVVLWLVSQFNPLQASDAPFSLGFSPSFAIFVLPLALLYIPVIGSFDRDSCIYPLREEFKASEDVQTVLDALGQLDELLSFIKYRNDFGGEMTLPKFSSGDQHQMQVTNARNPILAKHNNAYVGNDFTLVKDRLAFITGPNSGGKTAFCKTITQIQLLAQIGCFVPAKSVKLTVADRIFYQVPEISQLDDGEGRFGTELKRTKDIFLASSPKSLVVLDELSEGTTFEEKLETSRNVLDGFYKKGNNTILITHNHQLVDDFIERKIGIARQVEFAKDAPTFKLIKGISRVSHAHRVAKKIGFSKEDIAGYLDEESAEK
jgi:ABC-type Mn2+/Zn2+ transport system ATPase subunit